MTYLAAPGTARTAVIPFTKQDVVVHTWWTWVLFLIPILALSVMMSIPLHEGSIAGPGIGATVLLGGTLIGLVAVWICAPLAWLLGRALQTVPSKGVHTAAFAAAGAAVFMIATLLDPRDPPLLGLPSFQNIFSLVMLVTSAVACGFGRWMAFRARAKREATVANPPL